MMTGFIHDLRHGLRMLVKNPGFTVIAVVSIALGVGANAAMFSLAEGLVLRPLHIPRPGDIVTVTAVPPVGDRNSRLSYPDYQDIRDHSRSFNGRWDWR